MYVHFSLVQTRNHPIERRTKSICVNYITLLASWEEAIDVTKETEVKATIGGVASKMKEFNFLLV